MAAFNLSGNDYNSALVLGNGPTAGGRSYKGYNNNITILNDGLVAANAGGAGMSFSFSHWLPIYDPSMDSEITNYSNNPYGYSSQLNTYLKDEIVADPGNSYANGSDTYKFLIGYTGTRLRHSSNEDIVSNIKQGDKRLLEFVVDHDLDNTAETYRFYSLIHDEVLFKPAANETYKLLDSDKTRSKFIKYEGLATSSSNVRGFEPYSNSETQVDIISFTVPTKTVNSVFKNGADYTLSRWLFASPASATEEQQIDVVVDNTGNNRHYYHANGRTFTETAFDNIAYGSKFNTVFAASTSSISKNAIPLSIADANFYSGVHFTPQALTSEGRVRGVYEIEDGSLGENSMKFNKILLFITVGTVVVPFAVISFARTITRDVTGKHGLQRVNISFVMDFKTDSQSGEFASVQYGTGTWVQLKIPTLTETTNLNEVDTVLATQKGTWVYSFNNKIAQLDNLSQNAQQYVSKYLNEYGVTESNNQITAGTLSGKVNDGERPFSVEASVKTSVTPVDNVITNRAAVSRGILLSSHGKGTYLVNTYSDYNTVFSKSWTFLSNETGKQNIPDSHATLSGFTYGLAFANVVGQRGAVGKNTVLYGTGSEVTSDNTLLIGDNVNVIQYDNDSEGDDRSTRNNSLLALHTVLDSSEGVNPLLDWHVNVRAWKSIITGGIKNSGSDLNKTSTFLSSIGAINVSHNGLIRNSMFNIGKYVRNSTYQYSDFDQEDIAFSTVIAGGIINSRVANSSIIAGGSTITDSRVVTSTLHSNSANGVINSQIWDSYVWANDEIADSYIRGVQLFLFTDGANVASYGRFRYNSDNSGAVNSANPVSKQIIESAGNSLSLFNSNFGTIDGGNPALTPYFYSSSVKAFKTNIAFNRLFVASDVMVSSLQRLDNGDVYDYANTYSPARTVLIDNIVNSKLMGSFRTTGGRLNVYNSDVHITNDGIIYGTFVNSKVFGTQKQFAFFGDTNVFESDISIGTENVTNFSYGSTTGFYTKKLFESNSGWTPYYKVSNNSVVNKHVVDAFDGAYSIVRKNSTGRQAYIQDYKDVSGSYLDNGSISYFRNDSGLLLSQGTTNTAKSYFYSNENKYNAKNYIDILFNGSDSTGLIKNSSYGLYNKAIVKTVVNGSASDTIDGNINVASMTHIYIDKKVDYRLARSASSAIDTGDIKAAYKSDSFTTLSGLTQGQNISSLSYNFNTSGETLKVSGKYMGSHASIYDTVSYNSNNEFWQGGNGLGTNARRLDSSKKLGTRLSQRIAQLTDENITEEWWQPGQNRQLLWNYIGWVADNAVNDPAAYSFEDYTRSPIGFATVNGEYNPTAIPNRLDYYDFVKQGALVFTPTDSQYYGIIGTQEEFLGSGNSMSVQNKNLKIFRKQLIDGFARVTTGNSYTGGAVNSISSNFNVRTSQDTENGFSNTIVSSVDTRLSYAYSGIYLDESGSVSERFNAMSSNFTGQSVSYDKYADRFYNGKINKFTLYTNDAFFGIPSTGQNITSMLDVSSTYKITLEGFTEYLTGTQNQADTVVGYLSSYAYVSDYKFSHGVSRNTDEYTKVSQLIYARAIRTSQDSNGLPTTNEAEYTDGGTSFYTRQTANLVIRTIRGFTTDSITGTVENEFSSSYSLDDCITRLSGNIVRFKGTSHNTSTIGIDNTVTLASEGVITEYLLARKRVATNELQANTIDTGMINVESAFFDPAGSIVFSDYNDVYTSSAERDRIDTNLSFEFTRGSEKYIATLSFFIDNDSLPAAVAPAANSSAGKLALPRLGITRIS